MEAHPINSTTFTFVFKSEDGKSKDFARYYPDLARIGKHFLVHSNKDTKVRRHYTVSNCMRKDVYEEYIRVFKEIQAGKSTMFDPALLDSKPGQEITMTVKNYNHPKGLSTRLANYEKGECFEIKGPMGKGLDIQKSGNHVAFTAGTGVLVFVDLVAHLIRKNLEMLDHEEDAELSPDFKFTLFVSFQKREDGVALELCEALQKIC